MNEPTNQRKLDDLPGSADAYWEGAETYRAGWVRIPICTTHELRHESGNSYVCLRCPWGTKLSGYQRLLDGQIIDLRQAVRE